MIIELGRDLHKKVQLFKKWAKKTYPNITEDNDNGEWCFCKEFDDMFSSAMELIQKASASSADDQMIDDLLYAIARDNECEILVQETGKLNDWFSLLCRKSLQSPYTNAKWQFAKELKNHRNNDELKELIFDFLSTGDEYTERMALESLAVIEPAQAEKYAVLFWNREKYAEGSYEDEYQKIMALHVLYRVKSACLDKYLRLAEGSNYHYLKMNAAEIREKMQVSGVVRTFSALR
ncbi:hypothetical protein [Ruminococcus sp. FC2018]|uniref:hypothetical protein n=1 Tax=Ruminococcus sp. FC2018 TaxID=1410617 RepID=UPI0004921D93|nr:hypothetical protein [Ruminococcus sp. FC2018]